MPAKGNFTPAISRMEGKFIVNPITGCWEWQRSRSSQGRYPTIGIGPGRPEYAYKVAWVDANGPLPASPCPDGSHRWELHHACRNRACVNPDHIELLTSKQHVAEHNAIRAAVRLAHAA